MLLGVNRGDSDSLGASLGLTFQNSAGSEGNCRKEPAGCAWVWERRRKPSTFWRQGRGLELEAGGEGPDKERWKRKKRVGSRVMASTNTLPFPEETQPLKLTLWGPEPATRTSKQRSLPVFAPADHGHAHGIGDCILKLKMLQSYSSKVSLDVPAGHAPVRSQQH